MSAFTVTVRTLGQAVPTIYQAIGTDSAAVHIDAIDRFGVAAIFVTPA